MAKGKSKKKGKKSKKAFKGYSHPAGCDCGDCGERPDGNTMFEVELKSDPQSTDLDEQFRAVFENLRERCSSASVKADNEFLLRLCVEIGTDAALALAQLGKTKDFLARLNHRMNYGKRDGLGPVNGEECTGTTSGPDPQQGSRCAGGLGASLPGESTKLET